MTLEERIGGMVGPAVESLDFALVRVSFGNGTLQIMAEPRDEAREMTVDDCAAISRSVSAVLDVEDPIPSAFTLEVTSPGLSRPLVRPEDYERFKGRMAKVSLKTLIEGRRRLKGRLGGLDGAGNVLLDSADGPHAIPYDSIDGAKLDPSELFEKAGKQGRKG